MTSDAGHYVEDANLSRAWARAYLKVFETEEVQPLVVSVSGFTNGVPQEDPSIRAAVDGILKKQRLQAVNTVAGTIFPKSLWNPRRARRCLYERYARILPRVLRYPGNRHGTYFQRLVSFGSQQVNQLEHVLTTWERGNRRRSALVASIIDPSTDHTHQRRRGFPCLQQVCFVPLAGDALAIIGLYAMQYMLERAYGNYLGLARLGRFMATEMGLDLVRLTCVAAVGKRDPGVAKERLGGFTRALHGLLDVTTANRPTSQAG